MRVNIFDKVILPIVLVSLIVAALAFMAYIERPVSVHTDDLYENLMNSPAYVKSGFDIEDANVTNPETEEWDTVLPRGHNSNITINTLFKSSKDNPRHFLSIYDQRPEEYTIVIPFEIDAEKYEKINQDPPDIQGIFLAGIADDWEVFLNGDSILSEVDLNENGTIAIHHERHDISIPLEREQLKLGENILTFRIIGAPNFNTTGLIYKTPYFFGDYENMLGGNGNTSMMVFCSVYVFLGLYHILMYIMNSENRHNLYFGFFSISVAAYFFSRSAAVYVISNNFAVTQRIEHGSLYILSFLLAAFIERVTFHKIRRVVKIYGVFCVFLVVLLIAFSSIQFAGDLLLIWQIVGLSTMLYIGAYDVFYTFIKRTREKWLALDNNHNDKKSKYPKFFCNNLLQTPLGNIFITMLILSFSSIYDVLDLLVFHTSIVLSRYSFFIFTAGGALILARQYAESYNLANQSKEVLEAIVKDRTKELEEQVSIAEKASRAKSEFLANMSHEIRTPLNAVIGMTTIAMNSDDVQKKDYSLTKIDESSMQLLGIINDILEMSKFEAGKFQLSNVIYDFRNTINRVTHIMELKANEKDIAFTSSIDDNIPDSLIGDDQRLSQIITNLLSNAIKFTHEQGSIELSATLKPELNHGDMEDCVIIITIKDNGIGISEEQQQQLFESFQQAESGASRSYGGTGLGLALSKNLVMLMGGHIWVESSLGEGSMFGFEIHQKLTKVEEPTSESDSIQEEITHGEFEGQTALLAEDIEINAEVVMALLEETGLTIEHAWNGAEALEQFIGNPNRYDIILMDLQMPTMDGFAATRAIRESGCGNSKTIPIIALTANAFKEDIEMSMDAGMNEHVAKPIDVDTILTALRKYLKK